MATVRTVKKCPRCKARYMHKVLKITNTVMGDLPIYDNPAKSPLILNKYMKILPVWNCIGCGRNFPVEKVNEIPDHTTRTRSYASPRRRGVVS